MWELNIFDIAHNYSNFMQASLNKATTCELVNSGKPLRPVKVSNHYTLTKLNEGFRWTPSCNVYSWQLRRYCNCLNDAMKMRQRPPHDKYKYILLWNNCSRPLTDAQTWAKKNQRVFTCCSRCSWKDWGPPVNGWSDCPPGSPCCSCYWPPRRW